MTTEETLARYELMVVLKADRRDEEIEKHLVAVKKHVEEHGGKFFHEDLWGKRDLAYKIKGEEMGYYAVFGFEVDPVHVKEINNLLRIDQSLLRYLLQRMAKGYELTKVTEADLDFSKRSRSEQDEAPLSGTKPPKQEEAKKPEKEKIVEEKLEDEPVEAEKKTRKPKPEVVEVMEEEEEVEEIMEEKEEKKDDKKTIDDLDEKLKAIMNDTDIDISL